MYHPPEIVCSNPNLTLSNLRNRRFEPFPLCKHWTDGTLAACHMYRLRPCGKWLWLAVLNLTGPINVNPLSPPGEERSESFLRSASVSAVGGLVYSQSRRWNGWRLLSTAPRIMCQMCYLTLRRTAEEQWQPLSSRSSMCQGKLRDSLLSL